MIRKVPAEAMMLTPRNKLELEATHKKKMWRKRIPGRLRSYWEGSEVRVGLSNLMKQIKAGVAELQCSGWVNSGNKD